MLSQLKRVLPIAALGGALVTLFCLTLVGHFRQPLVTDTGETRPVVEAAAAELQALHPTSLDDPAFRSAVKQAVETPHVCTVWLIAPDGRFVYSAGGTAMSTPSGKTAEELATPETRRVLSTLAEGVLTAEQKTWLLAAASIQREGDHNDIYRHLLCPVRAPDGVVVALVGFGYRASAADVGTAYNVSLLMGLVALAVYWLSLPLWVLLDAGDRREWAFVWAVFVLIGNLVALIAYLLARSPRPANASAS